MVGGVEVRGEMKQIEPEMSLHMVMNSIQLRYMEMQAKQIADHLDSLLQKTEDAAPVRAKPYALTRNPEIRTFSSTGREKDRWQEKHWEEACYHKWADGTDKLHSLIPFRRAVSYQVMLRNTNADKGWGEIDLLGASAEGLPVVVELKSKTSEYILRALTEGVAYAVAIKKAWSGKTLRKEWQERLELPHVPERLGVVPVAVAAPSLCWSRWKGDPGEENAFRVPKSAFQAIAQLSTLLGDRGYPISFVELLGGQRCDDHGLPVIQTARPVPIS